MRYELQTHVADRADIGPRFAVTWAPFKSGKTTLRSTLWSEDTQVMTDCLKKLGFSVTVQQDSRELSNRTITVEGLGGKLPMSGGSSENHPLELFVGNAA